VAAAAVLGKPTSDDLTLPGSDSTKATDLLDAKLPSRANGSVPVSMDARIGIEGEEFFAERDARGDRVSA